MAMRCGTRSSSTHQATRGTILFRCPPLGVPIMVTSDTLRRQVDALLPK